MHLPSTYLFVPGNRPERYAKALAAGADRIIIDLEDAVAPADKAAARAAIAQWMGGVVSTADERSKVLIRINDAATPWHADDLALARSVQAPCVMLPKCESPSQVAQVLTHLAAGATVLALVETARGLLALNEIATAPGVARLAFGSLDYMVDLDIPSLRGNGEVGGAGAVGGTSSIALDFAANQIAIASRAAGLPSPVAGVTSAGDGGHAACALPRVRRQAVHPPGPGGCGARRPAAQRARACLGATRAASLGRVRRRSHPGGRQDGGPPGRAQGAAHCGQCGNGAIS